MSSSNLIGKAYQLAQQRYADLGVDTEKAMQNCLKIAISIPCWPGDDSGGFETDEGLSDGGIMATGNYPGKARNAEQLRQDVDKVFKLVPGKHRFNLHASYAETGGKKIERDELRPEHYTNWLDWAKGHGIGMDFNPTYFSHPKAKGGFTLASYDADIRKFWIEHGKICRRIGSFFGEQLGSACITNLWVPDGFKDIPIDRNKSRQMLEESLDEVFAEKFDRQNLLDSVESKLFGLGSESCVIGSFEFYLGYAIRNKLLLCLDTGHFHPTEVVSDKISSVLCSLDEILLHVSRPVRWDSDHIVIFDDELRAIAQEIIRNDFLDRIHIGLDFFDASINRVAGWVIGARSMIKALLTALLEPTQSLREMEISGDYTSRLAMLEELKTMPFAAVWDYYCLKAGVPIGADWLKEVKEYEAKVISSR